MDVVNLDTVKSQSTTAATDIVLDVENLSTEFQTPQGIGRAVDSLSFNLHRGETLGIVGESGCGKSITALSILRLVPSPPGNIVNGKIRLGDTDLLQISEREMRDIRGKDISMIFQEPMTSLNPVLSIGYQISETLRRHERLSRREAKARAVEMLDLVQIPAPERRAREFPHQLSGGMRQRAMIAMALSCNPSLLIADEPTTALDVTIQAQVLDLMNALRRDFKTAIMFITHDLGVIASMADDVIVMYLGKIVESGSVRDIFHRPQHPYTQGLLASIPSLSDTGKGRLQAIEGVVPTPFEVIEGCGFAPRCPHAMDQCDTQVPLLKDVAAGHSAACFLLNDAAEEQTQ